jgi:hypothetical protein
MLAARIGETDQTTEFTRRELGSRHSQRHGVGRHRVTTTRVHDDMERRRSTRAQTTTPSYVEPKQSDIHHPLSKRERWQTDWASDDDDDDDDDVAGQHDTGITPLLAPSRKQRDRARRRQREESMAAASVVAASATPQNREQRANEAMEFIATNRNANTRCNVHQRVEAVHAMGARRRG